MNSKILDVGLDDPDFDVNGLIDKAIDKISPQDRLMMLMIAGIKSRIDVIEKDIADMKLTLDKRIVVIERP